MRFIALEEHMYPTEIREAAGVSVDDMMGRTYTDRLDDLRDGVETRVRVMDDAGLDIAGDLGRRVCGPPSVESVRRGA